MADPGMVRTDSPKLVAINGQLVLPAAGLHPVADLPDAELDALVEALLLVAVEPPSLAELADVAQVSVGRIESSTQRLGVSATRGWFVQCHGDRVTLATAPRFAEAIRAFLGLDREAKLSAAALETLAIIAYRQPVTRTEIETFRGVDCSGVLAKLHARGLVEPVSRRATVGNPIQYGTTAEFLGHFGIRSLADLPSLGRFDDQLADLPYEPVGISESRAGR